MIIIPWNLLYDDNFIHCAIITLLLSSIISLINGKLFLTFLQKFTQSKVREFTPTTHLHKNNTPTMGGLFILLSTIITSWYMTPTVTHRLIILFLTLLVFGAIGFYDDWCKINKTRGISPSTKSILQLGSAILILSLWVYYENPSLTFAFPFISPDSYPYIGYFWILWGAFVMVGTSNAVNLTDGLDGLATQSLIPNFLLISLLATIVSISPAVSTDIIYFCSALTGSLCGFLWYNHSPAKIFMGDIGSLPLGAVLGLLFLILHKEYLLVISGVVFVVETVSVILQVYWITYKKARLFKMAPFHHHLELSGWLERKIVTILSLITILGCTTAWILR